MDVFSILSLFGGLALFLFGMHLLSSGLEKMAGGKLEYTLRKMTNNPIKNIALGATITVAIQSSSAMTVMLVGLVNSGILKLRQAISIIMGSNIGTTLTVWMLALFGLESSNIFIRLLQPDSFAPVIALIGVILIMFAKSTKKKDVGSIFVGFAILMFGMSMMSDSMKPLANDPNFQKVLLMFNNPIVGVIIGACFTGIIQSSAASIVILQELSKSVSITYGMAMPIIMGQNIGTCVTALLSSIGVNKNAKRVSIVHLYFNIIGSVFFLIVFYGLNAFIDFEFMKLNVGDFGIPLMHSIFNIVSTILLLPFSKQLEKLANFTIKDKSRNKKEKYELLDERLLNTPGVAIGACRNVTIQMADLARETLMLSMSLVKKYDYKVEDKILKNEEKLDMYEDKIGTYLVMLSGKELSDRDSLEVSKLLHTIGDFERIGDHACNIQQVAKEMHNKNISFSPHANEELNVLSNALKEILDITFDSFMNNNTEKAKTVEYLEEVIDGLNDDMKNRHIQRLRDGDCTIELGFIFSDLLNNYERVSDHCSNIALCIIQLQEPHFNAHDYINELKVSGALRQGHFTNFKSKYVLPPMPDSCLKTASLSHGDKPE